MDSTPLVAKVDFWIGTVPITEPVVITWCIIAVLAGGACLVTRHLSLVPGTWQTVLELVVGVIDDQIRVTMRAEPEPYRALIGTLLIFILTANWSSLVPGVEPPTAHVETDAALGLIVFVATLGFGIKELGLRGYLATFAQPTILMMPVNLVEVFTRTFSMIVRLFGNVMSGVFIIGIILSLAAILVPVPLMALDLLTGAVQAYIFAALAMVFIASALEEGRQQTDRSDTP
ncbi:F0F1 ATP synthase subunit A [Acuticoccus sediminis]|uniref:ATP synthase subunit a n=1 Tax=Acuticoccus sediminis TaxID=2184697 RepID=A0A8B2NUG6_9HYPH|nr:F0F1 ATP synthase subunit A [Acuticoccus sediminis]RAH99979.1 F0F1 ATP synthase subunit A [Acuticoccus sediminis]